MLKQLLIATFVVVLAGACAAKPKLSPESPLLQPVSEFLAEQEYLRDKLEKGSPRRLNEAEWEQFERIQRNFNTLLGDVDGVEELSAGERKSVFEMRRALVDLLVGEGELVCTKRLSPTGTRLGAGRHCVKKSRLEQEAFTADLWRNQFESTPQFHRDSL